MTSLVAASNETLVLAPVVGAYLLLSASGLLRHHDAVRSFFDDLARHPAALHAVGAIAFLVGGLIVSLHRHWSTPAEIAVSATGLWWAIEGAGMLASPAAVRQAMSDPRAATTMRLLNVGALVVGAYLLTVGIIGRAA